ncbi:hypothetical protein Slin15195_G107370 [Septoria linicola]|uniref:Uncharacterized protein n=1 Tax=Septoria linicola TaxID=215465 RepID=A0A9Q9B4M9_9PEZI|nr:hypothetical protein Slin14017_G070320 [Septoria linicola]USW57418.1 hypothetical protein Slin15195_G107370 [Septoria linicola]
MTSTFAGPTTASIFINRSDLWDHSEARAGAAYDVGRLTLSNGTDMDHYLQSVQDLACVMRDEPRALKVRALRDELREHVNKSMAELELLEPLAHLPGSRHWAVHHEATFQWALFNVTRPCGGDAWCKEDYYHPAVLRAARAWAASCQVPGAGGMLMKNHYLEAKALENERNMYIDWYKIRVEHARKRAEWFLERAARR